MTIQGVETAIKHVRTVYAEWQDQGFDDWREEHTRYAMIDPIMRALGWKTCDPKECHPEYPGSTVTRRVGSVVSFS